MLNLNIKYSIEDEVLRVSNTCDRMEWYKNKGYRVEMPKELSLVGNFCKDLEYIKKIVSKEFEQDIYKKEEKYILDNISTINLVLEEFFFATSIEPHSNYEILLTRYGVGGSYWPPNKIIINLKFRNGSKLLNSIIHEIIHLSIEDLIQKYKVDQWEKERLVDLIFDKVAPEINIMQKLSIDIKNIDNIFNQYYPNIEKIISEIKK